MTSGNDKISQIRVNREGICFHFESSRGLVALDSEVCGGGKLDGWFRVDTIINENVENTRLFADALANDLP